MKPSLQLGPLNSAMLPGRAAHGAEARPPRASSSAGSATGLHMGGCQNYGPLFGSLKIRGAFKRDHNFDNHPHAAGIIILTTTHMQQAFGGWGSYAFARDMGVLSRDPDAVVVFCRRMQKASFKLNPRPLERLFARAGSPQRARESLRRPRRSPADPGPTRSPGPRSIWGPASPPRKLLAFT